MIVRLPIAVLATWLLMPCTPKASFPGEIGDRPRFELRNGEKYFRVDGQATFVLGRNPIAKSTRAYDDHFRHAAAAGERLMRIHFTFSPASEKAGQIDPLLLKSWDEALDAAEQHGLAVLPVLGVWADWNDGSGNEPWHRWDNNPFSARRGGPAERPVELFDDSPCRTLWLQRLETFVEHWSRRRAIVAWEIFSELDLVTGSTQERAVEFAERAAAVVRAADPWKRPITASLSDLHSWPKLLGSDAIDFNEVHPYAGGKLAGHLDDLIIAAVRQRLEKYGKPVLVGECGLDSRPPPASFDGAPRADIGVRHAIWAAVVSGAMNGRMLWWQDGYDQFEKADLCRHYQQAAAPAAAFVRGIDFAGFAPLACDLSAGIKGAAVGKGQLRLGWFRDARCAPPDWPIKPLSGQQVTVAAAGDLWLVEFFDPTTGESLGKSRMSVRDQHLQIALPTFHDSIATRMRRVD